MKKEKKYKRGDVREDGMVFWQYAPSYANGERWVAAGNFAEIKKDHSKKHKEHLNKRRQKFKAITKTLKRGDVRDSDSKIFWEYSIGSRNFESWISPEMFKSKSAKAKKALKDYITKRQKDFENYPKPLSRGDKRDADDKVFYTYSVSSKNFEYWVSLEKFRTMIENANNLSKTYNKTPKRRQFGRRYQRKKRGEDPIYKLKGNLRGVVRRAITRAGYSKNTQTHELIGCSYDDLKLHLESKFTKGMSWDNMGDWHVDHILPLAAATTESEILKLCHYSNLQPLWARVNLRKGDKHDPAELKAYLAA